MLFGGGNHGVAPGVDCPFTGAAVDSVPQAGAAGSRSEGRRDCGRSPGSAVGVATGRPGAAGGDLLADEPDDAPDRAAVRGVQFGLDLVLLRAARERLRPVVMIALVAGLAVSP